MFHLTFSQLLGIAGVSMGVLATWFQYQKVRNLGVGGVSLATWYQFALMAVFWISYGVAVDSLIVVLGSALVLPLQLGIVWRLQPWRHLGVLLKGTAFVAGCCVVPTLLLGWSGGALGTGFAMTANRLPQIIQLVRHREHHGHHGVSAMSWAIGAVCSLMWTGYYLGSSLIAPLVATVVGMLGNIAIASLASWRQQRRPEPLPVRV